MSQKALTRETHAFFITVNQTSDKPTRLQALSFYHDVLQSAMIAGLLTHVQYKSMVLQAGRMCI